MSVEKAIREKHAFRDRLREFLLIAVAMTNDEIEIALGRLVDLLNESKDEDEKLNIELKGTALKSYYNLRVAGEEVQVMARRNEFAKRAIFVDDLLLNEIATFQLVVKGAPEPEVTPAEVKLLALSE